LVAESYGIPSLLQRCIWLIEARVLTNPVHTTELLGENSSVFLLTTLWADIIYNIMPDIHYLTKFCKLSRTIASYTCSDSTSNKHNGTNHHVK